MSDTTSTGAVTARLAEIKKAWEVFGEGSETPVLVAALEAVLAPHRPGRIMILGALCPRHENHRYFSITSLEAAGIAACPECAATVCDSCSGCGPQVRLDSCPVRAAITAELLGEGSG